MLSKTLITGEEICIGCSQMRHIALPSTFKRCVMILLMYLTMPCWSLPPCFWSFCPMFMLCVCVCILYLLCDVNFLQLYCLVHYVSIFAFQKKRKKRKKDAWMNEREECCNDGWMFLNQRPTMMCLAPPKKIERKKEAYHNHLIII